MAQPTYRNLNKYQQQSAPVAPYDMEESTPYVARPDLLQMKKKRLQDNEKAFSSQKFQDMFFSKNNKNVAPVEESLNDRDHEFNLAIQNFKMLEKKQQQQFHTPIP